MKTVTLHFSEALIRHAVKAFWWRTVGWTSVAAMLLLLTSFTVGLARGERLWWVGASGATLAIGAAFAAVLYVVHYRGSLARFRRLQKPEGTLELGEERFRIRTDFGSSEMPWSTVVELWRFPEFWLLFFSKAQFITLPTADLDEEARELILAKLRAQNAKIG